MTPRPERRLTVCRDCRTAIHGGNTCLECWRDRRDLATERDREWWAGA